MLEMLYENIGKKLKSAAIIIFIIGAIAAILTGISLLTNLDTIIFGIIIIIAGSICAYISSWGLYAFGE